MSADSDSMTAPDDREMFDAAVAETPAEPEPREAEPEKPEADTGPTRDERGRFASKAEREAEAEKAEAEQPERQPEQRGSIPPARLREEAEARRRAEDALATQQRLFQEEMAALRRDLSLLRQPAQPRPEPIKPPDLIEDPDGYRSFVMQEAQREYRKNRIDETFEDARDANPEGFEKAWDAIQRAPRPVVDEIIKAPNPGKALMRWHNQQVALAEVGTDVDSYRKRIADEARQAALNDPEFRRQVLEAARAEAGQPANRPNNVTKLPPSLNRATGARSNENDDNTPMSDTELFRHVTSR